MLEVEGQGEGGLRDSGFFTFYLLHHVAHVLLAVVYPAPAVLVKVVTQFTELHRQLQVVVLSSES